MTKAKPDCIGQKFGRLTVIDKTGRHPKSGQLYLLKCDCGNTVERLRNSFDRNGDRFSSCGCYQKELREKVANQRRKPDCTGQRFGRLVVLGEGVKRPYKNSFTQLYRLQCDCGQIIEKPRADFESGNQVSCGCARKSSLIGNKYRSIDITGEQFGCLTAIALTGKKDNSRKPTWLMQCNCGNICEKSLSTIRQAEYYNHKINCGDRTKHPDRWLHYPPAPNPYPPEAGALLVKYLSLTELPYQQIDTGVEDELRDRLIRACWIITYRRSLGEEISELRESRYIKKWLRYSSTVVFWKRKVETCGGLLYDRDGRKKDIGGRMTNSTSNDYPEIETRGMNLMSANPTCDEFTVSAVELRSRITCDERSRITLKHLKFRRC